MIDKQGFRSNVGIILLNQSGQVFWAKRVGQDAWQFPQGGMKDDETPEQTLYRELWEEIGLQPDNVEVLGCTKSWLRYRLPRRFIRFHQKPVCYGQKQRWYLLRLACDQDKIDLTRGDIPEFDAWCWVDYWYPVKRIITFKRKVYTKALKELHLLLK